MELYFIQTSRFSSFILLLSVFLLQACVSETGPAPVRDAGVRSNVAKNLRQTRPDSSTSRAVTSSARQKLEPGTAYKVQPGDTLYSIAWMYNADIKTLAEQNAISAPYNVFVGQTIHYSLPTAVNAESGNGYITHKVKVGDKLSVLAEDNGMRMSDLAKLNNIKPPYGIRIGQVIRIPDHNKTGSIQDATNSPKSGSKKIQLAERAVDQKSVKESKDPVVVSNQKNYSGSTKTDFNKNLTWRWPTKGNISSRFKPGEMGNKGIDIAGRRGQPVVAAASGRVVYAGNALRGYGNLIIIKHNEEYLSAYAHNDVLRVTEQQVVKAGQIIADMGNSESSKVQLHFEIRYRGQSVDPMRFLPKR